MPDFDSWQHTTKKRERGAKNVPTVASLLGTVILATAMSFAILSLLRSASALSPEPDEPQHGPSLEPIQHEAPAMMADAPNVPEPLARNHAIRAIVDLEVKEHVKTLADGVEYVYWTFGDTAPGKFIRVREGDLVEVRLRNHPGNALAHSIDFQSATGPGVDEASLVAPGQVVTFSWRATRPGLFLYQSKASPPGVHIANGLFGLLLVEPREGLQPVDREYQVVQSEFYTKGPFGEPGPQRFSMEKAIDGRPEYVVFNGRMNALNGKDALTARAGETVRIFFANAGPNLVSSFHVTGSVFQHFIEGGNARSVRHGVQTAMVPAGGSAILDFEVDAPGEYTLLDHSMVRAFSRGTTGTLRVDGLGDRELFSGRTALATYTPEFGLPSITGFGSSGKADGKKIYDTVCVTCHQADGGGLPNAFPPLKASDFLNADRERAIKILLSGLTGEILVNGKTFNSVMPNPRLDDAQIAAVLTYVLANFGNQGQTVTIEEVAKIRAATDTSAPLMADPAWKTAPRKAIAQAKGRE